MALLITALLGAGAIHFAMAPAHADWWPMAAAFAATAWIQCGLAAALVGRRTRAALWAVVGVSAVALAAWALSRTVGLPVPSHAGEAEGVGTVDLAAAGLELVSLAAALVALRRPASATARRRWSPAVGAGAVAMLTVGALASPAASSHSHGGDEVAGGHAHEDDAHEEGHGHEPEAAAATGDGHTDHDHATAPPTTVPAIAPAAGHAHAHGECTAPVTAEQQAAADTLVAATRTHLPRWQDFDVALAEGWVPITPEGLPIVHYAQLPWIADGMILEPTRPESIMYAFPKNRDPILLGAMYLMEDMSPGPQIGGCLTQWHTHGNLCMADGGGGMVAVVRADGSCPAGSSNRPTQEMLHVWGIDLPSGPFAETKPAEIRAALIAMLRG